MKFRLLAVAILALCCAKGLSANQIEIHTNQRPSNIPASQAPQTNQDFLGLDVDSGDGSGDTISWAFNVKMFRFHSDLFYLELNGFDATFAPGSDGSGKFLGANIYQDYWSGGTLFTQVLLVTMGDWKIYGSEAGAYIVDQTPMATVEPSSLLMLFAGVGLLFLKRQCSNQFCKEVVT